MSPLSRFLLEGYLYGEGEKRLELYPLFMLSYSDMYATKLLRGAGDS